MGHTGCIKHVQSMNNSMLIDWTCFIHPVNLEIGQPNHYDKHGVKMSLNLPMDRHAHNMHMN